MAMGIFTITIGHWQPGIGDPSFMGWFTVFSYDFVALLCVIKIILNRKAMEKNNRAFWIFLCFMMIALGLQKQFDLLSALTEIGRMIALQDGWLGRRRPLQAWAMVVAGVTGLMIVGIMLRRMPVLRYGHNRVAFMGLAYLILFVVLRGISLHQFGTVLKYEIGGVRINCLAELFGIYWIGLAAFWPCRARDGGADAQKNHS